MYEMPPILQGNERQQIAALRDYLVRMVRNNNAEAVQQSVQKVDQTGVQPTTSSSSNSEISIEEAKKMMDKAEQLRQLILKNANDVTILAGRTDGIDKECFELTSAVSNFGAFVESATKTITDTAKNVIENYNFSEIVTAIVGDDIEDLAEFATVMNGQIRRGWINDPETNETLFGIVISQGVEFVAEDPTENGGHKYYHIKENQTFGFYTATGWQFWIGGQKRGWFDSVDSMLHVTNIVSQNSFKLSAGWEMTNSAGFGIRYVGG